MSPKCRNGDPTYPAPEPFGDDYRIDSDLDQKVSDLDRSDLEEGSALSGSEMVGFEKRYVDFKIIRVPAPGHRVGWLSCQERKLGAPTALDEPLGSGARARRSCQLRSASIAGHLSPG